MHDEPTQESLAREFDLAENVMLHLMLDDPSPGLWSSDELVRAHGDPLTAADALAGLHAAGLVHRHAGYVWPTRAAARAARVENAI